MTALRRLDRWSQCGGVLLLAALAWPWCVAPRATVTRNLRVSPSAFQEAIAPSDRTTLDWAFALTNVSTERLAISVGFTSCQCLEVGLDREAIDPGDTAMLTVRSPAPAPRSTANGYVAVEVVGQTREYCPLQFRGRAGDRPGLCIAPARMTASPATWADGGTLQINALLTLEPGRDKSLAELTLEGRGMVVAAQSPWCRIDDRRVSKSVELRWEGANAIGLESSGAKEVVARVRHSADECTFTLRAPAAVGGLAAPPAGE